MVSVMKVFQQFTASLWEVASVLYYGLIGVGTFNLIELNRI